MQKEKVEANNGREKKPVSFASDGNEEDEGAKLQQPQYKGSRQLYDAKKRKNKNVKESSPTLGTVDVVQQARTVSNARVTRSAN